MALSRELRASLTPQEIEFLAGQEAIQIVPQFAMAPLRFMGGMYGPFRPPAKATVPLWLAISLKRRKRCTVVPPDWLSVESLSDRLQEEQNAPGFSALPFCYMEMARMILANASDDIASSSLEAIRTLLQSLREARQAKARDGISTLNASHLSMPGLGRMEVNEIRPFFVHSFGVLRKLAGDDEEDAQQSLLERSSPATAAAAAAAASSSSSSQSMPYNHDQSSHSETSLRPRGQELEESF